MSEVALIYVRRSLVRGAIPLGLLDELPPDGQ
jgi:hypothetical protein